ncbi:MAG: surface carbohydrate biosynthesis protein [Desulfobacterales bacterium]
MSTDKRLLLIPVENQVRELDPKLLLACVAARRGFSSVIGSRRELEFRIDSYPKSVYLSKSMTGRSLFFFRIARKFDHEIVTWDEEALVHLPPETYFSRRLHPEAIRLVSHLFAWGQGNVELWRQYPQLPENLPIHSVGNPRTDMLRPEMHPFYEDEVQALRDTYGDFLLINTNFNHVNAFGPDMNLFQPVNIPDEIPKFGRAAMGMSREYAEGLWNHKQAVFKDFQDLIPKLEQAFPQLNIVVRPHPTERHDVYNDIAAKYSRVHVTNQGNVVPWILATRAVLHNGCTTGIEAFMMGVPAISYRASISEKIDSGFYRLPNAVSDHCFNFDQLQDMLNRILAGKPLTANGKERRAVVDHYLASQSGPLACERMVDVLESLSIGGSENSGPSAVERLQRRMIAGGYHLYKRLKPKLPGSHNKPEFQSHRYPGISLQALNEKIKRIQNILKNTNRLKVEQLSDVIFRISV